MPITIGLWQRAMLAIATWFYSRLGAPLVYEVRMRNLNNKRQTSGVLTGSYPTLKEAIERQQRAATGLRPDFFVTITAVVTVSVHRPMLLTQPMDAEEEVFFNSRFDDAVISAGPTGKKWTARAYGTVLTPRSDDGKDNSPG